MKPILRILVILLSIVIVVIALLPPEKTEVPSLSDSPAESAAPAATAVPQSQKLIRDLLGGAAIDSGNKAKEKISELNKQREQEFEESGL